VLSDGLSAVEAACLERCARASTRQTSSSTSWPANASPPPRSPSSRPMRSGFDTSRRPIALATIPWGEPC